MDCWDDLAFAGPPPEAAAMLRAEADDFVVEEDLGFEPGGAGQHVMLRVEKRGMNTQSVAGALARHAGVRSREVGYAGLKDRHARTIQWFSVDLAGRPEPDWAELAAELAGSRTAEEGFTVLEAHRHGRKLRRGALRGNRFRLRLRGLTGERAAVEARLERVAAAGVPNYFGPQRFGRGGANLTCADALFAGTVVRDRHRRGLYLSAARACLFNQVLSARVGDGSWQRLLPGEAVALTGSHSFFTAEEVDAALEARLAQGDVSPSGPLWGRGALPSQARAREVELQALAGSGARCDGLERAGLRQERRALVLRPEGLEWGFEDDVLQLSFALPAGSYATAVVRELVRAHAPHA